MSRYSNQKRAKRAATSAATSSSKTGASKTGAGLAAMTDVKTRKDWMNRAVTGLDPALFTEHLVGWLEATAYLRSRSEAAASKDPIAALGGAIPLFSAADLEKAPIRVVADDAIFAFCIVAALAADRPAVEKLEASLTARFGKDFPGSVALGCCLLGTEAGDPLDTTAGAFIKDMLEAKAFDPRDIWNAGLRLLEKARQSNFVQELIGLLAKWHRDRWTQIITQQLFNVTRPRATVPPIEEVLSDKTNDQCFIACLLIAATGAVDLELDEAYRAHLQALARRG
jgi:hypothetical protein